MTNKMIDLENQYCAHNYHPLPVVLVKGEGIYVWDENGKQYIDMMSCYSALSFGHSHPKIVAALTEQAQKLALTSRAFYTDQLGAFLERLCQLTGYAKALPMNAGAEAVETAIKAVRKWAYKVKKIPENQAEIIVCENNFHGRTTTIVSMSSEAQYRDGFGPFAPGFKMIPYGDGEALARAITQNTAAFLVEPIQGEAGIKVPPEGYLQQCAEICRKNKVLLISDEIQTGLGRTGKLLAADHEKVKPDGVILGKALGGGLLPVSAFLSTEEVMNVFTPGDHGSTFGGNPLAAHVANEALKVLVDEELVVKAAKLGALFIQRLKAMTYPFIQEVRGKGLLIGVEIKPGFLSAREICMHLLAHGILTKDTHHTVIRFAPPLIMTEQQLEDALQKINAAFAEIK